MVVVSHHISKYSPYEVVQNLKFANLSDGAIFYWEMNFRIIDKNSIVFKYCI